MLPQTADNPREPLWRQLETALLAQIRQGLFNEAGRLPSEHELADRFGVNRHTARQALAGLVQRGVVFKRKGGGSYLVPGMIDYEIGERTRFSTNVMLQGREPSHTILEVGERAADGRVCAALCLPAGEIVAFIQTIGEADGIPISVGETYLSARRFPGFDALYRDTMSTTKALLHFGVAHYTREVTRVTARNPSQDDARNLRQPATTPVLAVESIDVDADKRPIVYHETRFAAERVQFVVKRDDDFD
jgi:GntR family phosphonate transport system transcriptional regulator